MFESSSLPPYDASHFLTSWNNEDVKGRGSFACVRKCEHKELGKVVAKCFSITGSSEKYKKAVKEIKREIEVLFRLDHKTIVQIRGITQWANNIGIIMECMDGGNLEDFLMSDDFLDIPLLLQLRFFHDIADGLSYIHHYDVKKSFVHSDLKPQNILLTSDLMIKIADFGSVNIVMQSKGASASIDMPPCSQFTEFYAAPEVLKDPMIQKKPSMDIYSFGMVGYEILTRRQVFQGANHNIVIQTIIDRGQKPDLKYLRDVEKSLEGKPQDLEIFKFLENLVTKCWEYEPEKRPDSLDVRNETNKKLRSLDISRQSYHINDLRSQIEPVDESLPIKPTIKLELNKFSFPFEDGPVPSSLQMCIPAETNVPKKTKPPAQAEQPSKVAPQPSEDQDDKILNEQTGSNLSGDEKHSFCIKQRNPIEARFLGNIEMEKMSEAILQQTQQYSHKKKWNEDDKRQLLSLWVQLYEFQDSSLLKRAAEYFPSRLILSHLQLEKSHFLALSGILRYTNQFIEQICFWNCLLHNSLFSLFTAALLESKSTIGTLDLRFNLLNIKEILDVMPRVRDEYDLLLAFHNGRGGARCADKGEEQRLLDVIEEYNLSVVIIAGGSTVIQSKKSKK